MPASFEEILNSPICTFIVGEDEDGVASEFQVHEEAIAQLSEQLKTLLKGELAEPQVRRTVWEDISKDTFERFVQFAYTGDYSIPKTYKVERVVREKVDATRFPSETDCELYVQEPEYPVEEPPGEPEPAPEQESVLEPDDDWGTWRMDKKGKKKVKGKANGASEVSKWMWPTGVQDFNTLSYPLLTSRTNYTDTCEPVSYFEKEHSYCGVLLSHATLYTLADIWQVHSLKALILYKLHKTLCVFEIDDTNIDDILELAIYAYAVDIPRSESGIDGLRDLVCQYMAGHAILLSLDEGFLELLSEGGQFVRDLWRYEVKRGH